MSGEVWCWAAFGNAVFVVSGTYKWQKPGDTWKKGNGTVIGAR